MNNFSNNEKYAIVHLLTKIMNADGIIHPKEEEFMNKVYCEFGITINNVEDIANLDYIQSCQIINEMSENKRQYAHSLFIIMAESDGYVHPNERSIINDVFK